jgi:hypothetical protein
MIYNIGCWEKVVLLSLVYTEEYYITHKSVPFFSLKNVVYFAIKKVNEMKRVFI